MPKNIIKTEKLSPDLQDKLLTALQKRFENNTHRHKGIKWDAVASRFDANPEKLWSLNLMEETGGEPDVTGFDEATGEYLFCDCSDESPAGRRSLCYDRDGLESRKEHKPINSAVDMAAEMGIELLTEEQYSQLQQAGNFDRKTSSWLQTPEEVRKQGGAIFGDLRYGRVFIYHNGAQSYYAARGFRGILKV